MIDEYYGNHYYFAYDKDVSKNFLNDTILYSVVMQQKNHGSLCFIAEIDYKN